MNEDKQTIAVRKAFLGSSELPYEKSLLKLGCCHPRVSILSILFFIYLKSASLKTFQFG